MSAKTNKTTPASKSSFRQNPEDLNKFSGLQLQGEINLQFVKWVEQLEKELNKLKELVKSLEKQFGESQAEELVRIMSKLTFQK